jgi:hypothetical protein
MALTNAQFNAHKIDIYCKLGCYREQLLEKMRYSIKDCSHMKQNLTLAAAMFTAICPLCLDVDDENYILTNDEINLLITYIKNLLC